MGVSVNLWIVVKDVKPLVVYDVECAMAMDSMNGKCASSWVIWGTPIYFAFLRWHQCSSLVVRVFLVILFSSIREIEVLYVYDWDHRTPQDEMQGNRASSCGDWEVSWFFSSCVRHLVYILELRQGWPFETRVCSAKSGLLCSYDGHLGKLNYAWQENTDVSVSEPGGQRPLLVRTVILVFLSIFTKSQASSPFEAMSSTHLSMCQKNLWPSVQKKWRTMAFTIVSTRYSVIPSSCEMKYDTAFKPLQGNQAFFWVSASRGPFHLRQKTQSPSHIPISEGRLLLRCLWNVGLPLQSKTGNHSHPDMIWGAWNIPQAVLLKLMILYSWDGCLRESLEFPKGSQAACSV